LLIFRRQANIGRTSTTEKFIGGIVDTSEQFFGGVVDTGDKF
jgi:hypothetical protein